MKALTVGLNCSHSALRSPAPLKAHRRMPPREKMEKKSSMVKEVETKRRFNFKP